MIRLTAQSVRIAILGCAIAFPATAQPSLELDPDAPPAAPEVSETPEMTTVTPTVSPSGDKALSGSNSVSASVVQMEQAISGTIDNLYKEAGGTTSRDGNVFGYYLDQYKRLGSTPYLYALGFSLDGFLGGNTFFMSVLWSMVLLFVAISVSTQLRNTGNSFMDFMAGLLLKLAAVTMVLTFPEFIYATAMTLQSSGEYAFSQLTQAAKASEGGPASRMIEVLKGAGTQQVEMSSLRSLAIRRGLEARSGIFTKYVSEPERDNVANDYWAVFMNRMSVAQATASGNGRSYDVIPRTGEASSEDIKVKLLERYQSLALDSSSINPRLNVRTNFDLEWQYDGYAAVRSAFSIKALSNVIQTVTAPLEEALGKTDNTPDGQTHRKELLTQYANAVSDATSNWVDTQLIDSFVRTMQRDSSLLGWFGDLGTRVTRTTLAATEKLTIPSLADKIAEFFSIGVMAVQKLLVPMLGAIGGFCLRLILELCIVGLMMAAPFYFFDGTKRAFTGALETMIAGSLMLPFWHFFQMLLDLLFSGITGILIGAGAVTGIGAIGSGALSAVGLTGGALALMLGLSVAYLGASVMLLVKTPGMVKGFLSGGAWVTGLIAAAAKGGLSTALIAGAAMTAGAGASIGGSVIGGGALVGGAAKAAGAAQTIGAAGKVASATGGIGRFGGMMRSISTANSGLARGFRGGANMVKHLVLNEGDPMRAYVGAREEKKQKKKETASHV